jgi:hypothetical protein
VIEAGIISVFELGFIFRRVGGAEAALDSVEFIEGMTV